MKTQVHKQKSMFLILLLMACTTYGQEATFQVLSITPEPGMFTFGDVGGLSADGSVVTGLSDSEDGMQAFRWEDGEIQGLGFFPGGNISHSTTVSYDGSVVIGTAHNPNDSEDTFEGFRWESGTGVLEGIGYLPNSFGFGYSEPQGTSADGSVIVGTSISDFGFEAFRWEGGEMISLGDFEGGEVLSYAYNTTADGSVIVGYGTKESGTAACKWENGEMIDLGSLGEGDSYAHNITPDGSIIIGQSSNQAFRWENGVMESLEGLLPEWVQTSANGISADGSVIVGFAFNEASDMEPFIWTEQTGALKIQEVLEVDYGLDLTDYTLSNASKVTHDGETITIIGWAWGPNLTALGWRATIPYSFLLSVNEPSAAQISVYPNPTTGIINLQANGKIESVGVYNLVGQKMTIPTPPNENKMIDLSGFSNGIYFIEVATEKSKETFKVIKK